MNTSLFNALGYFLEVMRPFGFDALQQSFAIKCLDNDKMILETQYLRLHFRKY